MRPEVETELHLLIRKHIDDKGKEPTRYWLNKRSGHSYQLCKEALESYRLMDTRDHLKQGAEVSSNEKTQGVDFLTKRLYELARPMAEGMYEEAFAATERVREESARQLNAQREITQQARAETAKVQEQLDAALVEGEDLARQKGVLRKEMAELTERNESLARDLATQKQQNGHLEELLVDARDKAATRQQALEKLDAAHARALGQAREDHAAKEKALKEQVEKERESSRHYQSQLEGLNRVLSERSQQLGEVQGELKSARQVESQLRDDLSSLKAELTVAREALAEERTATAALKETVEGLRETLASVRGQLEEAQQRIKVLTDDQYDELLAKALQRLQTPSQAEEAQDESQATKGESE